MILSLILEAFWEPGLLTFCFLVAPVANTCLFFGSQFPSLICSVESDPESQDNAGRCWLMVEVGGRSGASGGRGTLRNRALKGIVSHVQDALLPLDEVRRIYIDAPCGTLGINRWTPPTHRGGPSRIPTPHIAYMCQALDALPPTTSPIKEAIAAEAPPHRRCPPADFNIRV